MKRVYRSPASPFIVSSWSHRTGVSPTVTGASWSTGRSGMYTLATASHSHSSPNGHVPKPSTYGMCVCRTSASAPRSRLI